MYEFLPYMTNDYSTGLYSRENDDIFHSAYGALTEAYEKFVLNVMEKIKESSTLNVLDICYGVGYNTKALINETLKYDTKLNIDCVDTNKYLFALSPFIKSKISLSDRLFNKRLLYKNINNYKTAEKICHKLKNNFFIPKYKISEDVNLILMKNLLSDSKEDYINLISQNYITQNDNKPFFDKNLVKYYDFLVKKDRDLYQNKFLTAFVHNIYYRNITKRYKYLVEHTVFDRIKVQFNNIDIRQFIKNNNNMYDIIFLDGFTPNRCPSLWSLDLFKQLYIHMNDDALLVTYNTSTPVRNAMKLSGFYIGNVLNEFNKIIGTIASKNKNFILNQLSAEQEGLLDTRAGIVFRDPDLSLDDKQILNIRLKEHENSDKISSSAYYKKIRSNNEK